MMRLMTAAIVIAGSVVAAIGQEPTGQEADEAAIRAAVQAYVDAYNKGDAAALAALWAPAAVYTNPASGEQVAGREAIEEQFAAIFADDAKPKLEATSDSIRFISPNVALEQGTARVIRPEGEPEESTYSAVYIKLDGAWLLDRVSEEEEAPVPASSHEHLKALEWMIGSWVDQDEENRIETTCQWSKNRNFLIRSFVVSVRDRVEMAGMQVVGWDPAQKRIRSWVFDSDGGFNEGVWTQKENRWFIQSSGTMPDGGKAAAVNIITKLDDNSFSWQSVNRQAGGELLPNVDEVVVVRQTEE
jgi:uncharacterized protein (TIGR02246 family)